MSPKMTFFRGRLRRAYHYLCIFFHKLILDWTRGAGSPEGKSPKKELEILQNTSRTSHDMNYSLTTKISDSEKLTKNWFKMVLLDPEIHDLHLITPFSASKPGADRTDGRTHTHGWAGADGFWSNSTKFGQLQTRFWDSLSPGIPLKCPEIEELERVDTPRYPVFCQSPPEREDTVRRRRCNFEIFWRISTNPGYYWTWIVASAGSRVQI